ncbi:MAG: hypothetical protein JXR97_14730 [Planctomycetes bacterium]|nr:hypothetical protein [Planctomycetota bacterium]
MSLRLYGKFICLFAMTAFAICSSGLYAGEEGGAAQNDQQVDEAKVDEMVGKAPGLRMDPALFDVAAQFFGGVDVGEVIPAGAVSSAKDGFVVSEYKVLDANAAESGVFYRVRTLIGEPVRDVAISIDAEGKLLDLYDMLPPAIDEEASKKAKAEAEKNAKDMAENVVAFEPIRFKSSSSVAFLQPMVGMNAASEAMSLNALLQGIVKACNLASGKGVSGEDVKPADANALKVTSVLPQKGTAAPEFSYKTVDGKAAAKAGFRGKGFVVFVTAIRNLQGLTSEDALQRRGAVMMSRVSRWMFENKDKDAVKKRMLVVMADKAEDIAAGEDGEKDKTEGLLVADPDALKTFDITVNPMLLVYDKAGNLVEAFSATSSSVDYLKALDEFSK